MDQEIITNSDSDTITIQPSVPDRAIVVQSPDEIIIPEKNSAIFYIEIPLVLKIKIKTNPALFIHEIPSGCFSNTWYGDITGGMLAYSLNTVVSSEILSEVPPFFGCFKDNSL